MPKKNAQDRARASAKETAVIVEDALRSISAKIADIFEEAVDTAGNSAEAMAKDVTRSLNSLSKVANVLAAANMKAAEGALKQADIAKIIQERKAKIAALEVQIEIAQRRGYKNVKLLEKELANVVATEEEFTEELDKQAELSKQITKQMGLTGAALGALKTVAGKLGMGNISGALEDANAAALGVAKTSTGLGGKFKVLGAAMGSLGKSFLSFVTDPVAIIGLLTKAFVGLLKISQNFAKKTADVGKAFLGMGHNIKSIKGDIMDIAADEMYLNFEESLQAMKSLNAVAGTQVRLTREQTMAYQEYTNLLGLSEETTQGLFKFSTLSGESFDDMGAHIMGIASGLNQTNDLSVSQNEVMEEVANASAATAFNLKSSPDALAKAAFQAKRLGMTMDQITSAAESTLDFESSIEKEMAAELLLGKNLNLEQLRYASLTGDVETQAKEINRILAENVDATEGNVILQDALAASLGMSREDMLKANQARLLQNKLGKMGAKDRELSMKKLNKLIAAGATEEEALVELQKIGLENIQDQAKASQALSRLSETFKEKFLAGLEKSKVIDKINDMVKNFADGGGMEKIAGFIEKAAGALGGFITGMIDNPKKTLTGLGIALAAYLGKIFLAQKLIPQWVIMSPFKGVGKMFGKAGGGALSKASGKFSTKQIAAGFAGKEAKDQLAKQGGKLATKTVGKSLLKKIPVIGLLAGVGFGIQRALKGDLAGAALELSSGALSTIPGLGTAGSVAIDAGLAARDYKKATTASDFISRPGQPIQKFRADDIVVGGTSLGGGGNVEQLLNKILAAIENGGDVYMDGNKVGKSLALATSDMG